MLYALTQCGYAIKSRTTYEPNLPPDLGEAELCLRIPGLAQLVLHGAAVHFVFAIAVHIDLRMILRTFCHQAAFKKDCYLSDTAFAWAMSCSLSGIYSTYRLAFVLSMIDILSQRR